MATEAQLREATRDLNAKLQLESRLRPRVDSIHRNLVRRLIAAITATGAIPEIASIEAAALEPELLSHYLETIGVFGDRVDQQLPEDVRATASERAAIAASLAALAEARAPAQAAAIAATSQDDAVEAFGVADAERIRAAQEGEPFGRRDVAATAGAVFGRRLRGRLGAIVTLETQAVAEAAKLTEVETLMGVEPSAPGATPAAPQTRTIKTWVSQGDSVVRRRPDANHLTADGQERPVEEPFEVSGERLKHPGDTSLGASVGNVAGCRCSAVHDVETIVSARRLS